MNPQNQGQPPVPPGGYQVGGWYGGMQWNGQSFAAPGVINNPNQQGYGQAVSAEVQRQSNPTGPILGNPQTNAQPSQAGGGAGGGGGALIPQQPTLDVQAVYAASHNTPEIKAAQAEVDAKTKALNDAITNINDNPFYSEATRVGKIAKLNEQANADLTLSQNKLNALHSEADRQVGLATDQYNINRQSQQDALSRFNTLLTSGAFTNMDDSGLSAISAQVGIPVEELKSIQTTQQQKLISPAVVTDNAGNVTIIDKKTGQIIGQDAGIGKGKTGKASGSSTTNNNKNIQQDFQSTAGSIAPKKINGTSVGQFPQLIMQYAPSMSLPDIYKAYANTPLGKKNGAPKESAQDIKQIYDYYKGKPPKTNY